MTPFCLLLLVASTLTAPENTEAWGVSTVPSESECRPYIEKALKERSPQEAVDPTSSEQAALPTTTDQEGSIEETEEALTTESKEDGVETEGTEESSEAKEVTHPESGEETATEESGEIPTESVDTQETTSAEITGDEEEAKTESEEGSEEKKEEVPADQPSLEDGSESTEATENVEPTAEGQSAETPDDSTNEEKSPEDTKSGEENLEETKTEEASEEGASILEEKQEEITEESLEKVEASEELAKSAEDLAGEESAETAGGEVTDSSEATDSSEVTDTLEVKESADQTQSAETTETEEPNESIEEAAETTEASAEDTAEKTDSEEVTEATEASIEETAEVAEESKEEAEPAESKEETPEPTESKEDTTEATGSEEKETETADASSTEASGEAATDGSEATEENASESIEENESITETEHESEATSAAEDIQESAEAQILEAGAQENVTAEEEAVKESEPTVEDQLTLEFDIPTVRRPRDHITEILRLSPEAAETELLLAKTIDSTLKELKRLYDTAIKPLEILFKYRDLSNRHFGDPEIFSKPLILFMGPWSGGKSTILNYLLDNEFKTSSLRTGAEPSPAYFNILMWGEREEVLDGTQLAADWTFSGLQKFGQGLLDRLRGLRLNNPLLEKVNIVEIPGILEIRKQVERLFPFNDACQWFIDRADIIFLVYDPSKLDVGPETEAILDQLKGREYQTRIILNKADQVKPEELMRVQGTLIWNISPLMSSSEPPVMYSTSLWSLPYEQGAPSRLLHAQEKAFLRDLRQAVDRRVENKIASARRFAVRVRNHAKMVDCYLTTYYNHKSFFGNRKKVADDIIENPQNYHIYEGLSTLTNISRYDLPDPEVYRDFFRLNPLYDFQRLSDTCTYFRGCPINRLDVAIAYDLPELVGKYKKQAEKVIETAEAKQATKS